MADAAARLTHGRVLKIAVPIVLANATTPLLGLVDTGVVGQMGEPAAIGAVGIGSIILTAVYWIFGFLRMGTTGLTSQAVGAGDQPEADALLVRALMIGIGGGVLLILLQIPLFSLAFLVSPATDDVEALARGYMAIRIWSAPAAIALFGVTGWLIARERTVSVLVLQIIVNGLNIVLNLWFVLGMEWGVDGVAWATFIAEWSGLALGLWLCRGPFSRPDWRDWSRVLDPARVRRMAAVNRDILIRSLLLEAVFVSFLFVGSDFGEVPLAANQILLQFLHLSAFAMDGFAFSAETLVGQAMGARRRLALRRAAILTSFWGAVVVMCLSLVFWLFGGALIDVLAGRYSVGWEEGPSVSESDGNAAVREEARIFLAYMIAAPLLGWAAWMLDGIFIGATRTRDMANMMVISAIIYAIAAAILVPPLGNHGLWIALLISFVARGLTLGLRYPALEASADR